MDWVTSIKFSGELGRNNTCAMLSISPFAPSLVKVTWITTLCNTHSVRDPLQELQELFCRQTPGPRAYHSMLMHEDRLYILGGKQSEKMFYADAWYRGEQELLFLCFLFVFVLQIFGELESSTIWAESLSYFNSLSC